MAPRDYLRSRFWISLRNLTSKSFGSAFTPSFRLFQRNRRAQALTVHDHPLLQGHRLGIEHHCELPGDELLLVLHGQGEDLLVVGNVNDLSFLEKVHLFGEDKPEGGCRKRVMLGLVLAPVVHNDPGAVRDDEERVRRSVFKPELARLAHVEDAL